MTLRWRKSTRSGSSGSGQCVEVAWRKSSRSGSSGGGQCVEVGARSNAVLLRDSKHITGPILSISTSNWAGFLRTL